MITQNYNPDVLTCLANLSNDEVFTPPAVVNKMLDLLPTELWSNPDAKFLDPVSKTGVFLREIAKRLMAGLEEQIPDVQERANHIFGTQLYGLAITELTALMSRRSVYCSKFANGEYSICTAFDDEQGNIRFEPTAHSWQGGRCIYCGASQEVFDRGEALESHAYKFIHTDNPKKLFPNMKFDVIIGNPPYQLQVGNEGGNASKAKAIYHLFVEKAIKLNPRYLCMITPSRWMTKSTEGISEEWTNNMLCSNCFRVIHDFENSSDCFPGVDIMGGVNYFLYEKDFNGKCDYYFHYHNIDKIEHRKDYLDPMGAGIVIRDPLVNSILYKIIGIEGNYYQESESNFSGLVSPKDYFTNKQALTSSWSSFSSKKDEQHTIKYYPNKTIHKLEYGWIRECDIPKNRESIILHKVYIPAANGSQEIVLGNPFYGEPNSVCSQTFLVIGYDSKKHNLTETQCLNIISYIKTRFFRYLVSIKKKTQNGPRGVYQFVPIQDVNEPWTDEKLYAKYGLTNDEIDFIESMIRPME